MRLNRVSALLLGVLLLLQSGCAGYFQATKNPVNNSIHTTGQISTGLLIFIGTIAISFGIAASINGSLWSKIIGGGISLISAGLLIKYMSIFLDKYGTLLIVIMILMAVGTFGLWIYNHYGRSNLLTVLKQFKQSRTIP